MHTNFKLSAGGEFVGIFDVEANNFAQIDGISYGELGTDEAFGRLPNGTGIFQQVHPTPGASNEPVSTNEILVENLDWIINPNPFENEFFITIANAELSAPSVRIFDTQGTLKFEQLETFGGIPLAVNATNWASGLYFVVVQSNGRTIATKSIMRQ